MVCPDNPSENGAALLPVSRDWNFAPSPANDDWTYAVFDWDNIFASLLAGIGNKTIAYSNLIQVSQRYFVPTFSVPLQSCYQDRLGTNLGKALQKRGCVFRRSSSPRQPLALCRTLPRAVRRAWTGLSHRLAARRCLSCTRSMGTSGWSPSSLTTCALTSLCVHLSLYTSVYLSISTAICL
jgi:hypothetical protein